MLSKKEIKKLLSEIQEENKVKSYFPLESGWTKWDIYLSKFVNEPYISQPIQILELGVFEGKASQWFLNNIIAKRKTKTARKKSFLYTVDTFSGSAEYTSDKSVKQGNELSLLNQKGLGKDYINLVSSGYEGERIKNKFIERITSSVLGPEGIHNVKIMQMMSYDALVQLNQKFKNNFFDIVYIDASHEGRDVIGDAVMSWKLLKPGGIMIFDDYVWDKLKPAYFTPKPAIDAFLYLFKPELKVLQKLRQVIVEKLDCEDFEKPNPHPEGYSRC